MASRIDYANAPRNNVSMMLVGRLRDGATADQLQPQIDRVAATIAAGLHGIENELELEPEATGNIYEKEEARDVPKTLRAALEALDGSKVLRATFGDAVIEHYLHTGRWEQFEYDRRVTDWELKRNFERA